MLCPACQHESPAGASFCQECGASLGGACVHCSVELPATAKFCDACGRPQPVGQAAGAFPDRAPRDYTPRHLVDRILQSKSALEGERKQVSILFADVKSSMELAEQLGAEEWHAILERFFRILADGIHRFEGTINQYTGDGIMALFGAPIAHEDHAQRACYAALHLQEELRRYATELRRERGLAFQVRVGINSGEVVAGKIGDDLRMDYTAQGQGVGLAARMQQLAEPGRAYLTEHTATLVAGYVALEDLGEFRVKGASGPLRVYAIEGAGKLRTRLDSSRARGFTRFVGRSHELSILETALVQAGEGRGQVVGVVGEAGVGKSRLCFEFVEQCRAKGIEVFEAHCPAHGKVVPFLPLLQLLRAYFGINERDRAQEARRKIAGTLVLLDDALREVLPLVFNFLGVPDPDQPAPRMDPDARQYQLTAFVRRLFEARGASAPTVTLVDDLHWVDAGSDAFLAQVVEVAGAARRLLLLNFRPEYQAPWMQRSHYQQLPLMPLGEEATAELLAELLGRDPSVGELARRIGERAGGNPFFAEELVQALAESGILEGAPRSYRLVQPTEELALPVTVQAVLAARIDRLPEREKQLLQRASVIGKQVPEPVLRRVAELPEAELAASLAALTDAELLTERSLYPQREYAFKHPLTQEVAYGSQLAQQRARVHAAVARAIEAVEPASLDERAALVAHHWERAGEALEAARWHRRAARWIGISDATEAVQHWRRVGELAGSVARTSETRELAIEALTRILIVGWRVGLAQEETEKVFQTGMEVAREAGDAGAQARLLDGYAMARSSTVSGDYGEFARLISQAIALAEQTDDRGLQLALHQRLCWTQTMAGQYREAFPIVEQAIERSGGDVKLGTDVVGWSPYLLLLCLRVAILTGFGRLDEAARALALALERSRAENDAEITIYATYFLTELAARRGDPEAQLRHAREMVELTDRSGSVFYHLWGHHILLLALAAKQEWDATLELASELRKAATAIPILLPWNRSPAAKAHLGLGDPKNARAAAQEILDTLEHLQSLKGAIGILIRLEAAEVLLAADGASAEQTALRELRTASELIEETAAECYRPKLHELRAELARVHGDGATRERELREAHRLYVEMGATGHAERLAKELEP